MAISSARINRRDALRLGAGSILAVAGVALVRPGDVSASRVWCRADPAFRVNGIIGNVYVSGELDRVYDTTGPIQLKFIAPRGSSVELLSSDAGFGAGYDISLAYEDGLKNDNQRVGIKVEVIVPAASNGLPVLVEFVPDGTIEVADKQEGKTNQVIRVKTDLRRPQQPKGSSGPSPKGKNG